MKKIYKVMILDDLYVYISIYWICMYQENKF